MNPGLGLYHPVIRIWKTMNGDGEGLRPLVLGEDPRLVRAAVAAAGVLFLVGAVLDYLFVWSLVVGEEYAIVDAVHRAFSVEPIWEDGWAAARASWTWVYGYVLVVGLAGTHAYFDRGYLASLLLGLSPTVGTELWTIRGVDLSRQYVALTPMRAFDLVVPEAPLVATLGFFLGLSLRYAVRSNPRHHRSESAAAEE